MNKVRILYFGNEFIENDALAVRTAKKLAKDMPEIEFVHIKDTFQLMDTDFSESYLLDVADSINKVEVLDAAKIQTKNASSTHDFDLGFYLKLTGINAKIIAVPINYNFEKACLETKKIITHLHSSSRSKNG